MCAVPALTVAGRRSHHSFGYVSHGNSRVPDCAPLGIFHNDVQVARCSTPLRERNPRKLQDKTRHHHQLHSAEHEALP